MNILAIGSHPDDIEYGCSGTLGKFIRQGHDVYIMVMTHGRFGASPEVQIPEQLQEMRINEQLQANKILNVKEIFWGEYVDTQIPMGKVLIGLKRLCGISSRFLLLFTFLKTHIKTTGRRQTQQYLPPDL